MTTCHCDRGTDSRHEDDCDSDAAWIERAFPSYDDFEYDDAHGMADARRQEGR